MPQFILKRHGLTADDSVSKRGKSILSGWGDVELSTAGRASAHKVAPALARYSPTALVASDIERAKESALLHQKDLGMRPRFTPWLRPWNVGKFTGASSDTYRAYLDRAMADGDLEIPGGETGNQFINRVAYALNMMCRFALENPDSMVLYITHNSFLGVALKLLRHEDPHSKAGAAVPPGAFVVVQRSGDQWIWSEAQVAQTARLADTAGR